METKSVKKMRMRYLLPLVLSLVGVAFGYFTFLREYNLAMAYIELNPNLLSLSFSEAKALGIDVLGCYMTLTNVNFGMFLQTGLFGFLGLLAGLVFSR